MGLGIQKKHLTCEMIDILRGGVPVLLRTGNCEAAAYLRAEGIAFDTLDDCYDQAEDFDELTEALTRRVLARSESGNLIYGVLDLRDESVGALLRARPDARLIPGVPVDGALMGYAVGPCAYVAACD